MQRRQPNRMVPIARRLCVAVSCLGAAVVLTAGCASVATNDLNDRLLPSNFRAWSPEFTILPYVEYEGDQVTVHNVRNNVYLSETDFVVHREDRQYDLSQLQTVDFFVVPFENMEFIAHTMISFGFAGGDYLAVSVEIRTERGEKYSPLAGSTRQYEITYVVADEKDVVRLRTRHRDADVYLYRTIARPEQARELFRDVMSRVNELAVKPEFYDTITNNCTTNLVRHVNRVLPNRVPWSLEVLFPGFSDRYAYDLGILDRSKPFEELKRRAWINDLAERHYDAADFSQRIRTRLTRDVVPDGVRVPLELPGGPESRDDEELFEFIPEESLIDPLEDGPQGRFDIRDVIPRAPQASGWLRRTAGQLTKLLQSRRDLR